MFLDHCVDSEMDVSAGATVGCDGNTGHTLTVYMAQYHIRKLTSLFYHSYLDFYNWIDYSPNSPGLVLNNPQVFPPPKTSAQWIFETC